MSGYETVNPLPDKNVNGFNAPGQTFSISVIYFCSAIKQTKYNLNKHKTIWQKLKKEAAAKRLTL